MEADIALDPVSSVAGESDEVLPPHLPTAFLQTASTVEWW
jgi:hypothetical protein